MKGWMERMGWDDMGWDDTVCDVTTWELGYICIISAFTSTPFGRWLERSARERI